MTTDKSKNFFRVSAEDFKKIPGSPIAYWCSDIVSQIFEQHQSLDCFATPRQGLATSDNNRFVRFWAEVSLNKIGFNCCSRANALNSHRKWFPFNKGGTFRRWAGNNELVVNWENDGCEIKDSIITKYPYLNGNPDFVAKNPNFYFKSGMTWSALSSGLFSLRNQKEGFIFADKGQAMFPFDAKNKNSLLGLMNSKPIAFFLQALSPTLDFNAGYISKVPVKIVETTLADLLCKNSQNDWDSYETSWDFQMNPLCVSPQERAEQLSYGIHSEERKKAVSLISERYMRLRCDWQRQTEEMRELEIENNRIFIDAYGLQDELSPEVPWNEITLTCNPWYRYGKNPEDMDSLGNNLKIDHTTGKVAVSLTPEIENSKDMFPYAAETEQRLLEDTIKEFISYAVGCLMGRYSPEKPGLILANQGSTVDDYAKIMSNFDEHLDAGDLIEQTTTVYGPGDYIEKSFCGTRYHQIIDADGVLPILDEEWFVDDIVTQFKNFVAFIFGKENLTANMDFIEAVLGKDIRKYFVKDFYKEHIQRYKKRPIYWLFSSPKGSFNALIYLHRYTPDTVSIVLNEYLRELMTKLSTRIRHLIEENNRADISNADKTRNLKQIDKYTAQLAELEDYERDVIFPLAQQKIAIDLDDGVKVNYCKFGAALKKIPGLEAKEE